MSAAEKIHRELADIYAQAGAKAQALVQALKDEALALDKRDASPAECEAWLRRAENLLDGHQGAVRVFLGDQAIVPLLTFLPIYRDGAGKAAAAVAMGTTTFDGWLPVNPGSIIPHGPCVYRLLDRAGGVVYVGQTTNAPSRFRAHQVRFGSWVHRWTLDLCPTVEHAKLREAELINRLRPPLNRYIPSRTGIERLVASC